MKGNQRVHISTDPIRRVSVFPSSTQARTEAPDLRHNNFDQTTKNETQNTTPSCSAAGDMGEWRSEARRSVVPALRSLLPFGLLPYRARHIMCAAGTLFVAFLATRSYAEIINEEEPVLIEPSAKDCKD